MIRIRSWTVLAVCILSLAAAGGALAAAGGCHSFAGDFTAVAPAVCASPVGICTHGTLTGGFPSTYDFVADTLVPTAIPNVFTYTGHSTITTPQGALIFGSDSGVLTMRPDGTAPFATTVHVVGGTRQYAHAAGVIVAPGILNLATGATVGKYAGAICLGKGDT